MNITCLELRNSRCYKVIVVSRKTTIDDLARMMQGGFNDVSTRFEEVNKKFDDIYKRLDSIDSRVENLEKKAGNF